MKAFLEKFGSLVQGVLSGFDRLLFRGTLRNLAYPNGLRNYLWRTRVLHKDFDTHSEAVTQQLEEASLQHARQLGREIKYLNDLKTSPEAEAKAIAARDGIRDGLICVLRRVEPCYSFDIRGNHKTKHLEISYRKRRCVFIYHYQFHPVFGFMHARIQTWFPFTVYVCLNGHDWLARQMDQTGLHYQRRDNCFPWVEDLARAQALFDQQLQAHWPELLNAQAAALNPIHDAIFAHYPTQYYWSLTQSEWSSDVLFRSRADLQALFPRMVRHAITTYGAADILRFLGHKLRADGSLPAHFNGEVESNVKEREEGVRIKHWLNGNTLKLYDKGSVLRPECTIYNPEDFRVFRPKEGDPDGGKDWRRMRYGVADLYRRAEVCQAANGRYLDALAAVPDTTPLRVWVEPLCRRVAEPRRVRVSVPPPDPTDPNPTTPPLSPSAQAVDPTTPPLLPPPVPAADSSSVTATGAGPARVAAPRPDGPPTDPAALLGTDRPVGAAAPAPEPGGAVPPQAAPPRPRRLRALNPLSSDDSNLLEAVSRPEFLINGLRNRDVRRLLHPTEPADKKEERRRSAAISRKLRLLRAHGLLQKVPKTHRYLVSPHGRKVITALLAARDANADFLTTHAA